MASSTEVWRLAFVDQGPSARDQGTGIGASSSASMDLGLVPVFLLWTQVPVPGSSVPVILVLVLGSLMSMCKFLAFEYCMCI